jgi:DNA ligase 1
MFIQPMLLEKSESFSDPNWIYEPKMDGIRIILSQINNNLNLYTRHHNNVTSRYPELHHLPIKNDIILDGELICYDPDTKRVDFELCMERFMTRNPHKAKHIPVQYVVFDILYYNGNDLRNLPLHRRKEILNFVLKETEYVKKIRYVQEHGNNFFDAVTKIDLEGMVAKKFNSLYVSRRSDAWRKIINWKFEEVYLTGYKKEEFGWICSVKEEEKFRQVGIIEYGMSPADREAFYFVSKSLVTNETDRFVYLEPKIRAKVKVRNWTRKGLLRTPVFCEFVL